MHFLTEFSFKSTCDYFRCAHYYEVSLIYDLVSKQATYDFFN